MSNNIASISVVKNAGHPGLRLQSAGTDGMPSITALARAPPPPPPITHTGLSRQVDSYYNDACVRNPMQSRVATPFPYGSAATCVVTLRRPQPIMPTLPCLPHTLTAWSRQRELVKQGPLYPTSTPHTLPPSPPFELIAEIGIELFRPPESLVSLVRAVHWVLTLPPVVGDQQWGYVLDEGDLVSPPSLCRSLPYYQCRMSWYPSATSIRLHKPRSLVELPHQFFRQASARLARRGVGECAFP